MKPNSTFVRKSRLLHCLCAMVFLISFRGSTLALAQDALPKSVDEIVSRIRAVAARHSSVCSVATIAQTGGHRDVLLLTLSAHQNAPSSKPALLVTAGLDSTHTLSVDTALRLAEGICATHAELLNDVTFYVIACANPDGFASQFTGPRSDASGAPSAIDDDRDGAIDEDPPVDLNHDGYITVMRRLNPPIDDAPSVLPDSKEPRLLKSPDAAKGEHAIYSLYTEGLDADRDGLIAEDGTVTINLNRNFPEHWPEHSLDAGLYPLSQPETAGIAKFVIAHNNIFAAVTFGTCDNLINAPDSNGRDPAGAPKDIDGGDAAVYKEISQLFKDTTGQKRAVSGNSDGSLHSWLYAHRGIPSFATNVWGRPDPSPAPAASQPSSAPESQPENTDTKGPVTEDSKPGDTPARPAGAGPGGPGRRGGGGGRGGRGFGGGRGGDGGESAPKTDQPKANSDEDEQWLEYSDRDRNHEGFVEWMPFDHPTLGKVEIGGFVPGFKFTPPADQLAPLADKETEFVIKLAERRPKLEVRGPVVKKLAPGIYDVKLAIANTGVLPSSTAIARRARSIKPIVVRISPDLDHIVSGQRVQTNWGIDGGSESTYQWIIRADDHSSVSIELNGPDFAKRTLTFTADDNTAATPAATQPLATEETH
ncbi:MAG TPA: M14 family metallopeptidase [Phycisphaerales bacterium]|nr:M14 family metallopeptidase [Phycisphaerales bacterium]